MSEIQKAVRILGSFIVVVDDNESCSSWFCKGELYNNAPQQTQKEPHTPTWYWRQYGPNVTHTTNDWNHHKAKTNIWWRLRISTNDCIFRCLTLWSTHPNIQNMHTHHHEISLSIFLNFHGWSLYGLIDK